MHYLTFKKLELADSEKMSELLLNSSQEYIRYFHPFDFSAATIRQVLAHAERDMFFGIVLRQKDQTNWQETLIGFYMLRGLDEGFSEPMYGVFIAAEFQGKGIARLTLNHAECYCKLSGYTRILLKVHPDNKRARHVYESSGFLMLRSEPSNNNFVLYKDMGVS